MEDLEGLDWSLLQNKYSVQKAETSLHSASMPSSKETPENHFHYNTRTHSISSHGKCPYRLQQWFTTNPHAFPVQSCVWSNLCPLGLDLAFYLTKISNVLSIHHTTYFREICGHSYLPWEIFKCLSVLIVTRNHFPLLMNYRVPYSFEFLQSINFGVFHELVYTHESKAKCIIVCRAYTEFLQI